MRLHRTDLTKSAGELQSCSETLRFGNRGGRRMALNDNRKPKTCQFIEGEPTRRELRCDAERFKCRATTKPGSSYCTHHHSICYKPLTEGGQPPASEEWL